jgi:hypothetical protein
MTIYIKLTTGEYPRHQGDVRLEYPEMGDDFVLPDTYAQVQSTEPPEHDLITQRAEETFPVLVNNVWVMQWHLRNATQEEMSQRLTQNRPLKFLKAREP